MVTGVVGKLVSTIQFCTIIAVCCFGAGSSQARSTLQSHWENSLAAKIPETPRLLRMGKAVYETGCVTCHGRSGKGDGPAARLMTNKPRDYTTGEFKLRTTPWGTLPSDEDLFRTVTVGFPQYGMPSFRTLSIKDRWAVVYYVKGFLKDSGRRQGSLVEMGREVPMTKESVKRGKALYEQYGCMACHGEVGRGDGPLARHFLKHFEEDDGTMIRPRDFNKGRLYFKGGGSPRDIVRTLVTGLEGTRMVSYLSVLDDPKDLGPFWDIAHYLSELQRGGELP